MNGLTKKIFTALCLAACLSVSGAAQENTDKNQKSIGATTAANEEILVSAAPSNSSGSEPANDKEEEKTVQDLYADTFKDYFIGPEDVISVEVFAQCPNYCKTNITVPPNGKISYPLIGAIVVRGKTTDQLEKEIAKKLDEYIIDPQITVSLDKAMSARYTVIGEVTKPGVRVMSRRLTITEALADAEVTRLANRSKIAVLRRGANPNQLEPIYINVKEIEKGKAPMFYLDPGDQIVVGGNKFKTIDTFLRFTPLLSFANIFGFGRIGGFSGVN